MVAQRLVGDELALVELGVLGLVAVDAVFDLASELPNEALYGPGSGVTQCANGVSFNLVGKLFKHVNLGEVGIS